MKINDLSKFISNYFCKIDTFFKVFLCLPAACPVDPLQKGLMNVNY